jgi:hypothetical protein
MQQSMKWVLSSFERELKTIFGNSYEMNLTCGARCEKHNAEVGGAPNSAHTIGLAADIGLADSRDRDAFMKVSYTIVKIRRREDRLLNHGYVHIDIATGAVPRPTYPGEEYQQDVYIVLP